MNYTLADMITKIAIKSCLILALIFNSTLSYGVEENEVSIEPIRILASRSNQPFSHTLADGTITGLYVEFWQLWSKVNNIPVNIEVIPFDKSMELLKQKGVVHSGVFINEERKQWLDFLLPIHRINTGLIYNNSYPEISELNELKGAKVGVVLNTFQHKYLSDNYPSIELLTFLDTEQGIESLAKGDIRAFIGELPRVKSVMASQGFYGVINIAEKHLMTNTVHPAIAKGQPKLLKLINDGIKNIPIEELINLERKWLPTDKPFFSQYRTSSFISMAEKE